MKPDLNKIIPTIKDLQQVAKPSLSFEFFPPKNEELEKSLWQAINDLKVLNPDFVSVTYGAGGTTRTKTHETVKRIRQETVMKPAAHLTCVGHTKEEIAEIAEGYWKNGIKHIVALRGDAPAGQKYEATKGGFNHASELVSFLKNLHDFEISVAAFPEKHPEAVSLDADIDALKAKQDAGAKRAISQFFLDPYAYLNFVEKARKSGVTMDIIPGIIVIANFAQFMKFAKMCESSVPQWVINTMDGLDEKPETRDIVACSIISEVCKILITEGVDHLHFYTLNRSQQVLAIARLLGIKC